MDDYLFIAQAKLKADLVKVGERRDDAPVEQPRGTAQVPATRSPPTRRGTSLSPDLLSVVSTHGLRGWS